MRTCAELLRVSAQALRTQPAYNAGITRMFASNTTDGSMKPLAILPDNEYDRKAIIYRPSGPSGQYGYNNKAMHGGTSQPYKIWLPTQEMWTNPLMGWASSSDVAESSFRKMSFGSVEQAAAFLKKVGLEYTVDEKPANFDAAYRPKRYQGYGDNFSTRRGGTPDLSHLPSERKKPAANKAPKKSA